MQHFTWDDSFSVENQKMDRQHKQLFEYINEFYDAVDFKDHSKCIDAFDKVISFTTYHFRDEELLMEQKEYPQIEQHKRVHQELVEKVTELADKLQNNEPGIGLEIKLFLKKWLTSHIMGVDMQYSSYLIDDYRKQHRKSA